MKMTKDETRALYREKRMKLSEAERTKLDDLMLIRFQTAGLPFLHAMLNFWPIEENNEPNTHLFTDYLRFTNPEMRICYPVADFEERRMQAIATDIDTAFMTTVHHIVQPQSGEPVPPQELDLVFVPLLAFDEAGYRLGYGKGFYDIYLAHTRPDCIKVGFSYFEPLPAIPDRHEFDVPLDLCITPQSLYVF